MTISILIPSTHDRQNMLDTLLMELHRQIHQCDAGEEVEILCEIDNYNFTTGYKRQQLLNKATGQYCIAIDSDDWVYPCYIYELLTAAESNADCFATNGIYTIDGQHETQWRLSKDYPNTTIYENGVPVFLRKTNHITGVKREIALKVGFPDVSQAEDKYYSDGINPFLKTEYLIKPRMYHYRYTTANKRFK